MLRTPAGFFQDGAVLLFHPEAALPQKGKQEPRKTGRGEPAAVKRVIRHDRRHCLPTSVQKRRKTGIRRGNAFPPSPEKIPRQAADSQNDEEKDGKAQGEPTRVSRIHGRRTLHKAARP